VGAVKCYLLSGMESFRALDQAQLVEAARCCARLGLPLGVHAEDAAYVRAREAEPPDPRLPEWETWWRTRPGEAERLAACSVAQAARESGAHLHVVHLGSGAALQVVRQAQAAGLRLSAETCPHYLAFTREDFPRLGSVLKTVPPVKEAQDRQALWQGLREGSIAWVATDHAAGQWPQEKQSGTLRGDYGGIPGVEHLLPFLLTHGVQTGLLSLDTLVDRLCAAPARFFGIADRKGALSPGMDADFVVVDDAASWTVDAASMHTLNRYTPLHGAKLGARVLQTWVRGRQVFTHSGGFFPQGGGWGRFTRRHGRDRG
jgi:allantoinase